MIHYKGEGSLVNPDGPKILSVQNLQKSEYLQLRRVTYLEDGSRKTWDVVNSYDSSSVMVYDTDNKGFIFVRQLRMSVFMRHKEASFMYELCAGINDKHLTSEEIAIEELEEECGYRVESMQWIHTFYSSANGARQDIYFTNVNEGNRVSDGGGNKKENEKVECVFVPDELAMEFLYDRSCPKNQALSFAVMWYLTEKRRD